MTPFSFWTLDELDAFDEQLTRLQPPLRLAGRWALSAQLVALRGEVRAIAIRRAGEAMQASERQLSLVPPDTYDGR